MPFEKFTKKGEGGNRSDKPWLSVRKSGTLGLNNSAKKKFFEEEEWVVLYYDKVNELIGLEPRKREAEGAYKVRKSPKEGHGAQINCRAFTSEYGLSPDKTTRYSIDWDSKGEKAVADLSDPLQTVQG